ncbi:MAG: VOC family protein [Paraglaciecola chathamensis]
MISHLTLGTNNLQKAQQFFEIILKPLRAKPVAKTSEVVFFAFSNSDTKLAVTKPFDGDLATAGNGTMLALKASSQNIVKSVYKLAIDLKAEPEGEPGPRNNGAYFAAYFRDLDGNKIAVFHRSDDANA